MRPKFWVIGVGLGITLSLAFLFWSDRRSYFLPGQTSDGHHSFEQSCNSCHVRFASVPNKNCSGCHQAETQEDTHPIKLFDDPRWADMLRKVNALECVNCHGEHKVAFRGVTVDQGFCYPCHDDVTTKRASHRALKPNSCWDGGCHNYHDNTALNIAFLKKRLDGNAPAPINAVLPRVVATNQASIAAPDAPASQVADDGFVKAWQASFHARMEVNCSDCHGADGEFNRAPGDAACARCHVFEIESFKHGKHGAKASLKLAALTPADARRPMKNHPAKAALGCATCHDPHAEDTRFAAVQACLGCHDDSHSKNFTASKHGMLFAAESTVAPSATAVTCATCHMPRTRVADPKNGRVAVNHNNSWTLLPRDRMVKEVCLNCHSLEFSLNSIFDDALIRSNFRGVAKKEHETVKMVREEIDDTRKKEVSKK